MTDIAPSGVPAKPAGPFINVAIYGESLKVLRTIAVEDKIEPGEVLRRAWALLQVFREAKAAGHDLAVVDPDGKVIGRIE